MKVGDRVKVIKAHWDFPVDKVGSVGKVVDTNGDIHTCVEFKFTNENFHSCNSRGKEHHCYYMPTEYFEKVKATKKATPKATRKPRELKVGDTVRLIEEYENSGMVGELAVIKKDHGSIVDIEFINKMPRGRGHDCSGTCIQGHGWYVPKANVELATKSKKKEELAIDPRTFYKILRIDGSPANADARATGFKYTLPVDGPTEWTPTTEGIVTCRKGYHVTDAEHIKIWLNSYDGDLIVCEAKARGEIKSESDKYVAQSIQLTKILRRWNDIQWVFEMACQEIRNEANKLVLESYAEHEKRRNVIREEARQKGKDAFNKLVLGG